MACFGLFWHEIGPFWPYFARNKGPRPTSVGTRPTSVQRPPTSLGVGPAPQQGAHPGLLFAPWGLKFHYVLGPQALTKEGPEAPVNPYSTNYNRARRALLLTVI